MSRNRVPTGPRFQSLALDKAGKSKYRYLEFKYLYFQVQKLIHKKVVLSLKYEQMRTPEIRTALIKPIVQRLVEIAKLCKRCLMARSLALNLTSLIPHSLLQSLTAQCNQKLRVWAPRALMHCRRALYTCFCFYGTSS